MRSSLLSAAALLCLACGAYAQQPPPKVAVISLQGALVGTKDGQKASQELQTKFAPREKEFKTRQDELAQLQDQYSKGGNLMSEDKRNQLARDIDEKKKRLERDMQDANEELNSEQQRVLQGLGQRLMAVIEKYAKDNAYTMVLDDSNPSTPILYASMGIDITQEIISLYDRTSTNGAPATTPGAAGATSPGNAVPKPARPASPGGSAASRPPGN